jgi:hypothetical protein
MSRFDSVLTRVEAVNKYLSNVGVDVIGFTFHFTSVKYESAMKWGEATDLPLEWTATLRMLSLAHPKHFLHIDHGIKLRFFEYTRCVTQMMGRNYLMNNWFEVRFKDLYLLIKTKIM